MEKKTSKISVMDIVLLVLSMAFFLGILFVFDPCGPKEDGGWMTCHWAGQAVTGLAAVLVVIALVHLFAPNAGIKTGLDIAAIPVALLAAILPGNLISLCMMNTMKCHTHTKPGNLVFSVLIAVASAVDIAVRIRKLTVKAVKQQEEI